MGEIEHQSAYHHLVHPGTMVLLGGWRKSRSWVMDVFLIVVLALLSPIVLSLDTESGFLSPSKRVLELRELGMLANYPGYQAILPPFKRNGGGGLNFKRNGGVPDECRGKYDTSIYTQLDNICEDCYNLSCWRRTVSSTWCRSSARRDSTCASFWACGRHEQHDQPSKACDDQHEPQRQGFSVFPWSAVQAGTLVLRREVKETKACCIFLSNHPLHLIA